MADQSASSLDYRKVRLVNRIFYRVMTTLLRRFILRYFQLHTENAQIIPKEGKAILLANHLTLFDPIWLYAMVRRPVYFAATEDLFRKRFLGNLIRWFGAFPKRKAASDIASVRSIFKVADNGGIIGVFPEGVRSWDGSNQPIYGGIAKLIRKIEAPVYVCRLEGAYFAYPRWARRWRRIPVRGVFFQLFDPSKLPDTDEEILEKIAAAIKTPDFELPFDAAKYHKRGLAVNLPRLLYRCPSCGTQEGLKLVRPFSTNRVECSSCFSSWVVDATCRMASVDENGNSEGVWRPLPDYYRQIKGYPLSPIRTELNLGMKGGERLYLISRPRFLFRQEQFPNLRMLAFGRAFLTNSRLLFRTRLGIQLDAPLAEIAALSVDPGDKLHFTFGGKLYRIPFRNESALKWYDTIIRLKSEAR